MIDRDPHNSGILSESLNTGLRPSALLFEYRGKTLSIPTGANEIEWEYDLKTNVTPTYGGEVIQVLGASVGPMKLSGNTISQQQYYAIKEWFKAVMVSLGTGSRRNELPVLFKYPERGWSFYITPIEFGPWQLGNELVATEWFLTAEVVSPTSGDLVDATLSARGFNLPESSLLLPDAYDHWRQLFDPAVAANNFYNNEQMEEAGTKLDKVLAHMVGGGLDLFGRNDGASEEPDDVYTSIFGSKWLISPEGETSSGGATTEPTSKLQIVSAIVSVFEEKGIPGRLGVAVALQESSNLDPDARQPDGDYAVGLFQTFPTGAGGSASHSKELKLAFNDKSKPVTDNYTALMQITAASEWTANAKSGNSALGIIANPKFSMDDANNFQRMALWAQCAQAASVDYRTDARFKIMWKQAGELIQQAKQADATSGASGALLSTKSGKALSDAIINHPKFLGFDNDAARNDIRNYQSVGLNPVVPRAILGILDAGWSLHISSVKTNRGGQNHGPGRAVDFNNYGPGGAFSNAGGTSSPDPTAFIAFLKANRTNLGGLRIGYGSPSPSAGADFADKTNHVHVDWTGSV